MCLGTNGEIAQPGERVASTSNRNFVGRQGPGARTHLMSPAMAAAAAVTGHLTDVRELAAEAAHDRVSGHSMRWRCRSCSPISIPTRSSRPRFLSRARGTGLGDCLFRDLRFTKEGAEIPAFILNQAAYRAAQITVGERNFGCGSSRENAVWALYDYGFRAAIAPSFGDIFYNNSLKNGLLPVRLAAEIVARLLAQLQATPGAHIGIDLQAQTVRGPDGAVYNFEIDPFSKHCLLNGIDELEYTLTQADQITAFENRYGRENV